MPNTHLPNVAVLQFPGSNCESETARVLRLSGLNAEIFRWNRPADELHAFDATIIPGGFSYEDRVRAGAIAAKEPLLEALTQVAKEGKPVLGICNGAQILLETGLLPGLHPGRVEMALAHNYMTYGKHVVRRGHHCGWIDLRYEQDATRTPFTQKLVMGDILPMTVSHGEGRFVSHDPAVLDELEKQNLVLWRYCDEEGETSEGFPINPNGSYSNIAGLCNPQGNVVALMPHPERAFFLRQVPAVWPGEWGERRRTLTEKSERWDDSGPGSALFVSLAKYLKELNEK